MLDSGVEQERDESIDEFMFDSLSGQWQAAIVGHCTGHPAQGQLLLLRRAVTQRLITVLQSLPSSASASPPLPSARHQSAQRKLVQLAGPERPLWGPLSTAAERASVGTLLIPWYLRCSFPRPVFKLAVSVQPGQFPVPSTAPTPHPTYNDVNGQCSSWTRPPSSSASTALSFSPLEQHHGGCEANEK